MPRWRALTIALIILALALWAVVFSLGLRPELGRALLVTLPPNNGFHLQEPLTRLPGWVAPLELFVTLFLAGLANLLLFPARVRTMLDTLSLGWQRIVVVTVTGIAFGLLLVVFAIGAALARITFPFTILAAFTLVFLAVWGFLSAAYALGRLLFIKAGWSRQSPVLALALGLLLLLPLIRIPFAGGVIIVIYVGLGLGLVISTHFGSNEAWRLMPLLEESTE